MKERICPLCGNKVQGRSDKKFCNIICKNTWHQKRKLENITVVDKIDQILHKNRTILQELMQQHTKRKVSRLKLEDLGFNFAYCTGVYQNKQGKWYHYVYDFAWMLFSDQEVLIVKQKLKL